MRLFLNTNLVYFQKKKLSERIETAVCIDDKKSQIKIKAKKFVLACGGIENARLMLDAGRDLPLSAEFLGSCFMEHPSVPLDRVLIEDSAQWSTFLSRGLSQRRLQEGHRDFDLIELSDEVIAQNDLPGIAMFLIGEEASTGDSIDVLLRSSNSKMAGYSAMMLTEVRPNPLCKIRLSTDKDWTGLRKPILEWALHTDEMQKIQNAADIFAKLASRTGSCRVRRKRTANWSTDHYYNCHHIGTTRMASDKKWGVVDRNCQAFSTDNLFVSGSSVFATSGVATPTFTIVALAIRLADHLKTILGKSL